MIKVYRLSSFVSLFLFIALASAQQNFARLAVISPTNAKETDLKITELSCKSELTGNIVTNTWLITFSNEFSRQLEGNLEFPLSEGENVVRFALDINGLMREGVVVDKNKGQKVFEDVERRRVDPGLLEKTKGNNYRARIFPIPAGGTRTILIATEKIVAAKFKEDMQVSIPLVLNAVIKKFKLDIIVRNENMKPSLQKNEMVKEEFKKQDNSWVLHYEAENFNANSILFYTVNRSASLPQLFVEKEKGSSAYFFSATVFPSFTIQKKKKPDSLLIVWDNSFSGLQRNSAKEIDFITQYIARLKNVEVSVIACNIKTTTPKNFKITGGDSKKIIQYINSLPFDGATQLGQLDLSTVKADEIILVSDGVSTFGSEEIEYGKIPVYTVVSSASADYNYMKFISSVTGGNFINLAEKDVPTALKEITVPPVSLVSFTSTAELKEVYYDLNFREGSGFSICGMSFTNNFDLVMNFGIAGEIFHSEKIQMRPEQEISNSTSIERTWATQKMNRLLLLPEKNKEAVMAHSTKYNVVSPFTSLIVLENVSDYVLYEIAPPQELMAEYTMQAEKFRRDKDTLRKQRRVVVEEMYKRKLNWWQTDYYKVIADIKAERLVEIERKK